MGIINVLEQSVANLIAAGEVVERPASAIKEMAENSIDAGATEITAEIKNGGISFLRVTDTARV
jgi:DNA mismatch repair protein MutL